MTLYDLIEEVKYDKESLTRVLINLDSCVEYLHNRGFCILDFNPKKIVLENRKLTFNSFRSVLGVGEYKNAKRINIFQENKIGLMAYNNMPVDGNMNQEHFDFLQTNLEYFNKNGQIPDEIYEYYEEVFRRLNVCYMNDYLVKKQQEKMGNQNINIRRKSLATAPGTVLSREEAAFVNILFIPTLITFVYILSLFIYVFVLK